MFFLFFFFFCFSTTTARARTHTQTHTHTQRSAQQHTHYSRRGGRAEEIGALRTPPLSATKHQATPIKRCFSTTTTSLIQNEPVPYLLAAEHCRTRAHTQAARAPEEKNTHRRAARARLEQKPPVEPRSNTTAKPNELPLQYFFSSCFYVFHFPVVTVDEHELLLFPFLRLSFPPG